MRGCRVMAMVCLMGIGLGADVRRAEAQQTRTWVGPDGGNWSDPNNWSPAGPLVATDDLEFDATAPATSNNDLLGLHIIRLWFNGTHTVAGNGISLFGLAVASAAVSATVNVPLTLRGDQDWFIGFPTLGVNAPIDLNGFELTITSQSNTNIGVVTGDGGIVKAGNGLVQLLGASDFTGQVQVLDGTLRIDHPQSLGTADGTMANGTVVAAGATLWIESILALDEPLQVSGLGHNDTGAIRIAPIADVFELAAPVELTHPDDSSLVAITGGPPPVVTFSQPLTGTGLLILDDTTVVLAATGNAFTRAGFAASPFSTTANGTLRMGVDNALPPETTVDIAAAATFDLAGHSAAVGALTGVGTVAFGAGGTLSVVSPGATFTAFDGTISGTGTLYKQGAGSLGLTGANTFTGSVHVNTGELWVLHPNALGVADGTPANGTVVTAGATLGVGVASLPNEALTIAGAGHSFGALERTTGEIELTFVQDAGGGVHHAVRADVENDGVDEDRSANERSALAGQKDLARRSGEPKLSAAADAAGERQVSAERDANQRVACERHRACDRHRSSERADLQVGRSFGMRVMFQRPGIAERAMYFGTDPIWTGGHASAGVTLPWPTWFLAEGATGEFFDTFILVANPGEEPADVTLTFLPEIGEPATMTRTVPGLSRLTVNVEGEPELLSLPLGPVATQVSATRPVVAERAQYWPFSADRWVEAHNSFGVTDAAVKWGLAEGRVGGDDGYQTFVLLANPGTTDAMVTLRFLGDGVSAVPVEKSISVPAQRRVTVPVEAAAGTPPSTVTTFGTVITSDQPIVVERAMYWNAGGQIWAAGTNATASRLP